MTTHTDPLGTTATLSTKMGTLQYHSLPKLADAGWGALHRLPVSIRILLENALRHLDHYHVQEAHIRCLADWGKTTDAPEIPFRPARVLLQDFTGVPAVVDLAAMRSAMQRLGGEPQRINPQVPVDLVIDHSIQVDHFGSSDALQLNVDLEFSRNQERYEFLRWGQQAFDNFRVVPPNTGIVHQVNLEYLAKVATVQSANGKQQVFPDTLVGTDSHTTMINGLGVLGWGVGGIEAEAVMLGQPIYMRLPEVVGVRLNGRLPAGSTATDLVLVVTEVLRKKGVVGKFVEFCGEGLASMSLPDRATLANMAPEYGATMGLFPVDGETLRYLADTGRSNEQIDLVERYYKEQQLFVEPGSAEPSFSELVEVDLATVAPSLAGPKRPQDRLVLSDVKRAFQRALQTAPAQGGFGLAEEELKRTCTVSLNGRTATLTHGNVVIAAITSCTNTSNPAVMMTAALLAKNAVERGLAVPPYVKTSLAPGSRVVTDYLERAGLVEPLQALGFHTVGYGCTTCIGNSGPLSEAVGRAVSEGNLVTCSVLSGNRNFEGRVHSQVKANYLASPPLVVAYALAGTLDIDLTSEPLGTTAQGQPVFLKDIWPTEAQVAQAISTSMSPAMFKSQYHNVLTDNPRWNCITSKPSEVYPWQEQSSYIQEPPFFIDLQAEPAGISPIHGARVLMLLGDSVTTDHISPAGAIPADGPAGQYLQQHGITPRDFNSFGSRRGNDRVMTRGTFANIRIKNLLAPGTEGGLTECLPEGRRTTVFEAAEAYRQTGTPLMVIAGKDYGMGSSRDWAAKGTLLLGVKAVLAKSFERIHRSNLVGMGVLPLEFKDGQDRDALGLTGKEIYNIELHDDLKPGADVSITAADESGNTRAFAARLRVDTAVEMDYYRHGGILPMVLRQMLKDAR